MALSRTIPVAAKATGDVEVPILSQQILARPHLHGVWIWADRSPGHRDGGPESQAAETGWCDTGLGLGTTGQGEEEPCSRGGAADDDTAKDGRLSKKP